MDTLILDPLPALGCYALRHTPTDEVLAEFTADTPLSRMRLDAHAGEMSPADFVDEDSRAEIETLGEEIVELKDAMAVEKEAHSDEVKDLKDALLEQEAEGIDLRNRLDAVTDGGGWRAAHDRASLALSVAVTVAAEAVDLCRPRSKRPTKDQHADMAARLDMLRTGDFTTEETNTMTVDTREIARIADVLEDLRRELGGAVARLRGDVDAGPEDGDGDAAPEKMPSDPGPKPSPAPAEATPEPEPEEVVAVTKAYLQEVLVRTAQAHGPARMQEIVRSVVPDAKNISGIPEDRYAEVRDAALASLEERQAA